MLDVNIVWHDSRRYFMQIHYFKNTVLCLLSFLFFLSGQGYSAERPFVVGANRFKTELEQRLVSKGASHPHQLPLEDKLTLCEQVQQPYYNLVSIAPGVRTYFYKVWVEDTDRRVIDIRSLPDQSTWNAYYLASVAMKAAWAEKNAKGMLSKAVMELHEAIDGMLAYVEITGIPGYVARGITFEPIGDSSRKGQGQFSHLYWRGAPAKGTYFTYNMGLALTWHFARHLIRPDYRARLQKTIQDIALRVIDTNYNLNQGVQLLPEEDDHGNVNPYTHGFYNPFNSWGVMAILSLGRHPGSSDRLMADFPDELRGRIRGNHVKIIQAWDAFRENKHWYRGNLIDPLEIPQYVKHMSEDSHVFASVMTLLLSELSHENSNNWNPKVVQEAGRVFALNYASHKVKFLSDKDQKRLQDTFGIDLPAGLGKYHPGGPIIDKAGNPWFHAMVAYLFRQKNIRRGVLSETDPNYQPHRVMQMAKHSQEEAYKILKGYSPDRRNYLEPKEIYEFREDWTSEYGMAYVPIYARPSTSLFVIQNGNTRSSNHPKTEATIEGAGGGHKLFNSCSDFTATYWILKHIPPVATCDYAFLGPVLSNTR